MDVKKIKYTNSRITITEQNLARSEKQTNPRSSSKAKK